MNTAFMRAESAWHVVQASLGTRPETRILLIGVLVERLAHCRVAHRDQVLRGLMDRLSELVHPGLLAAVIHAAAIILDSPTDVREQARDAFIDHLKGNPRR